MKRIFTLINLIIFTFLFKFSLSFADPAEYASPIEGKKIITGSFSEFRETHFHAGVDISSDNQIGYHLFAVASGYLQRIKISPYGYGKAVYLKLYDGNIIVYAHLNNFSEKIKKLVKNEQQKNNSFWIDSYFVPNQISIEKEELIGYSGDSGGTTPHLHLEFRNEKEEPLNIFTEKNFPRSSFFKTISPLSKDSSPLIKSIALIPQDTNSFIDGLNNITIIQPQTQSLNHYFIKRKLSLWGKIGLEIQSYDDVNGNKIGISEALLNVNDQLHYKTILNSFPYSKYSKNFFIYDRFLFLREKPRFLRLFKIPGNDLQFSENYRIGDGLIDTANFKNDKPHKISITAFNATHSTTSSLNFTFNIVEPITIRNFSFQKNDQELMINLKVAPSKNIKQITFLKSPIDTIDWQPFNTIESSFTDIRFPIASPKKNILIKATPEDTHGVKHSSKIIPIVLNNTEEYKLEKIPYDIKNYKHYLLLKLPFLKPISSVSVTLTTKTEKNIPILLSQISLNEFQGKINHDLFSKTSKNTLTIAVIDATHNKLTEQKNIFLHPIDPKTGGTLTSDDLAFLLSIPKGHIFSSIYPEIKKLSSAPILNNLQNLELKPISSLYDITPKEELLKRYTVSFSLPSASPLPIGIFSLQNEKWKFEGNKIKEDIITARTKYFSTFGLFKDTTPPTITKISPSHNDTIYDTLPLLTANVTDNGSGLIYTGINLMLNGKKVFAEYNINNHQLFYKVKAPLKKGTHNITIEAEDKTGNKIKKTSTFYFK